jgi:hypothetical protein
MDLLNALLDLADAISAGVAVAGFWSIWVVPPSSPTPPPQGCASGPDDELARFLRAVALIRPPDPRIA